MYAAVMAGGFGTRFWPMSRNNLPKQFLKIIGNDSLLKQTMDRIEPLIQPSDCIVIINNLHLELTDSIVKNKIKIIAEPIGRNTAPCIGLAAVLFEAINPKTPMVILSSDHFIADDQKFREVLNATIPYAQQGHIVTIGIKATRPETGYGYIKKGQELENTFGIPTYSVESFVEKPDLSTAVNYLVSKQYFWNAGIFIFTPEIILEEIRIHLPVIYQQLQKIKKVIGTDKFDSVLKEAYNEMSSISIDYGIMEQTKRPITVIEGSFGWSDVGSWLSLYQLREDDKDSLLNIIDGNSIAIDTQKSMIINHQKDKILVSLGLKEMLLINTDDAVLAMPLQDSQRIREIIDKLKEKNLSQFL